MRRRAVEAELRVLAARGGELEREFPFGVVRQLFEPAVLADDGDGRVFAGAAGAARPIFEAVEDGRPADGSSDPSFAVLHGLFWLTVNLSSERPLLVAVDDLHWCDRASLRFLAYLIRRLEGLPVLAVCSLRPSEPGIDTMLLGEIAGDPLSISVRPGPLSEAAVSTETRSRVAPATAPARCGPSPAGSASWLRSTRSSPHTIRSARLGPDSTAAVKIAPRRPILLRARVLAVSGYADGVSRTVAVAPGGAARAAGHHGH